MMKIAPALNGTASLLARRFCFLFLAVGLLSALALVGGCGSDDDKVTFPDPPPETRRDWLYDVYGTAADNVFVGGNQGVMFHFDGAAWTLQNMGSTAAITTIWAPPTETTLYAVGHKGHIWRNTGSGWSGMDSGTTKDLYGIGSYQGQIHAVGAEGTIRRLTGSTWGGTGSMMVILDENSVPLDTLQVTKDLSSMLTVNHYFLGGAYFDPKFTGVRFGINGTKGNVLAPNTVPGLTTDWILRPISGDQRVDSEWVLSMSSDPATLSRNYLGTSEGWLFRLVRDDNGKNVWKKFYPEMTSDPGAGIRDIWVDAAGNVYVVTDEGKVFYQTEDYDFTAGTGRRLMLYNGPSSLVGIWGTGPDNIYFAGYYDDVIFHAVHDPLADTFTIDPISLVFPDKATGGGSTESGLDEIGRPLR
jgi:hypothetical protein